MSERVLGILSVMTPFPQGKKGLLFITSDRVILYLPKSSGVGAIEYSGDGYFVTLEHERTKEEYRGRLEHLTTTDLENVLKADKHNFAIPNSEITKVELKKRWGTRIDLNILTSEKKHRWDYEFLHKKGVTLKDEYTRGSLARLEDCENLLRPIFGDKLSVKK